MKTHLKKLMLLALICASTQVAFATRGGRQQEPAAEVAATDAAAKAAEVAATAAAAKKADAAAKTAAEAAKTAAAAAATAQKAAEAAAPKKKWYQFWK